MPPRRAVPAAAGSLVLRLLRVLRASGRLPGVLPGCYTAVTLLGGTVAAAPLAPRATAPVHSGRADDGGDLGAHPGGRLPGDVAGHVPATQRPVRAPRAVGRADAGG